MQRVICANGHAQYAICANKHVQYFLSVSVELRHVKANHVIKLPSKVYVYSCLGMRKQFC